MKPQSRKRKRKQDRQFWRRYGDIIQELNRALKQKYPGPVTVQIASWEQTEP